MVKYIYVRTPAPLVKMTFEELMELVNTNGESPSKPQRARGTPVGCIAYEVSELDPLAPDAVAINWGYSVWNTADRFTKKDARNLAKYRLETDPYASYGTAMESSSQLLAYALKDIACCTIHAWAGHTDTIDGEVIWVSHPLSAKFRQACLRTAENLLASEKKKEKAA